MNHGVEGVGQAERLKPPLVALRQQPFSDGTAGASSQATIFYRNYGFVLQGLAQRSQGKDAPNLDNHPVAGGEHVIKGIE